MTVDDRKSVIGGGTTGGTTGTGQPDTRPEGRVGAAADVTERDGEARTSLAGGDDSVEPASGEGSADKVAGTGSRAGQSGRLTIEGTGAGLPNPPDAGDPGGMGDARAGRGRPHDRPPGGVSPIDPDAD